MTGRRCKINSFICGLIYEFNLIVNCDNLIGDQIDLIVRYLYLSDLWLKYLYLLTSSSHMRVMNHNWSATKQRLRPQSVAEISRHSVLSIDRIRQWTMWDIVWVSPQGHRAVSVSRHLLLQAPQCPCSVQKWFSRDKCCWGRSKPSCRIVGSHTRWELTTWADFQLCLHRLLMSTGCKSSYSGFWMSVVARVYFRPLKKGVVLPLAIVKKG